MCVVFASTISERSEVRRGKETGENARTLADVLY